MGVCLRLMKLVYTLSWPLPPLSLSLSLSLCLSFHLCFSPSLPFLLPFPLSLTLYHSFSSLFCFFLPLFYLSLSQVGLFRKSGVKSRIQALRQMNEACGADGGGVNYEGQSAYDVADMLKQYFRDLPEPLLTSKLSETFLQIYQCKCAHTLTHQ